MKVNKSNNAIIAPAAARRPPSTATVPAPGATPTPQPPSPPYLTPVNFMWLHFLIFLLLILSAILYSVYNDPGARVRMCALANFFASMLKCCARNTRLVFRTAGCCIKPLFEHGDFTAAFQQDLRQATATAALQLAQALGNSATANPASAMTMTSGSANAMKVMFAAARTGVTDRASSAPKKKAMSAPAYAPPRPAPEPPDCFQQRFWPIAVHSNVFIKPGAAELASLLNFLSFIPGVDAAASEFSNSGSSKVHPPFQGCSQWDQILLFINARSVSPGASPLNASEPNSAGLFLFSSLLSSFIPANGVPLSFQKLIQHVLLLPDRPACLGGLGIFSHVESIQTHPPPQMPAPLACAAAARITQFPLIPATTIRTISITGRTPGHIGNALSIELAVSGALCIPNSTNPPGWVASPPICAVCGAHYSFTTRLIRAPPHPVLPNGNIAPVPFPPFLCIQIEMPSLRQTAIAPTVTIFGGEYYLIAGALTTSQIIFRGSKCPGSLIFPNGNPKFFVTGKNTASISGSMNATFLAATIGTVLVYASAKSVRDSLNRHRILNP